MSTKKQGDISVANIIALVGLAAIGVISFFGALLHSPDGRPAGPIIGSLFLVAVLGGLLILMIKAKTVKQNPDKWVIVEWAALVIYVLVAVMFAGPFQNFFYVMSEKDNLQSQALSEVKEIKDMYEIYNFQQKNAIDKSAQDFMNYKASGQAVGVSPDLDKYVSEIVGNNVDAWKEKAIEIMTLKPDNQLKQIENELNDWNILQLSSMAVQLEDKESKAWNSVTAKIKVAQEKNKLIPLVAGGGGHPYYLNGYYQFELPAQPQAKFAETLRKTDGSTVVGWVIYVILNCLVLLNLLVVRRSGYVAPKKGGAGNGGGLDL